MRESEYIICVCMLVCVLVSLVCIDLCVLEAFLSDCCNSTALSN